MTNRAFTALSTRRVLLVSAILFPLLAGCATVPITGRKSFNVIPDSQASALGADAYRDILSRSKLITSGSEYERMVRIGQDLARVADRPDFEWEFQLIDEPKTVNAFCLPGGKVAVYTGILPVTANDAGLAVVMGHEIAHAIARHGAERMTNQLALQMGGVGLDVLLREKSPATRQITMAAFGLGGQVGFLLPFGREQESEADHIGLVYMAQAGYDPREAPLFWQRMSATSGGQPPEFLSTHPAHETRVENLERWMPEALAAYSPRR